MKHWLQGTLDYMATAQNDRMCLTCDRPVAAGTFTLCGELNIHDGTGMLSRFVCICRKCAGLEKEQGT